MINFTDDMHKDLIYGLTAIATGVFMLLNNETVSEFIINLFF